LYPNGKDAALAENNLKVAEKALTTSADSSSLSATGKAYYDAVNLIKAKKYEEAIEAFKKIADGKEEEWTAKSEFEIGNSLFLLNRFEDCIKYYSELLEKKPEHPDTKDMMLFIAQSYERIDKNSQAMEWYQKIMAMPVADDRMKARAKQAIKELE
jgi:TolA-binding protein